MGDAVVVGPERLGAGAGGGELQTVGVPSADRGERALDDRHDPDDVAAALAGAGEVGDVEDRELRAAVEQAAERGRLGGRRADPQGDSLRLVEPALARQVDPGIDGGRRGIERARRARVRSGPGPPRPPRGGPAEPTG